MLHESEYNQLRAVLTIDPNALDDDLIHIAMQQMSIAEYTAAASSAKDHADFQYDQVVADIAARLRQSDEKISEARIKSETLLYDEVTTAYAEKVETERDYLLWRGLADAIRTKSTSIGHISDLIKAGYMTPTTIRHDRQEQIHQHRQQQAYFAGTNAR